MLTSYAHEIQPSTLASASGSSPCNQRPASIHPARVPMAFSGLGGAIGQTMLKNL